MRQDPDGADLVVGPGVRYSLGTAEERDIKSRPEAIAIKRIAEIAKNAEDLLRSQAKQGKKDKNKARPDNAGSQPIGTRVLMRVVRASVS